MAEFREMAKLRPPFSKALPDLIQLAADHRLPGSEVHWRHQLELAQDLADRRRTAGATGPDPSKMPLQLLAIRALSYLGCAPVPPTLFTDIQERLRPFTDPDAPAPESMTQAEMETLLGGLPPEDIDTLLEHDRFLAWTSVITDLMIRFRPRLPGAGIN